MRNLVVRAPVDGIVQELAVTSAGQSVGSNQPLMKLVPTGGGLVIEARVANQDIGYVRLGQPVTVKVLAYDFLRFGTLSGTVERIAADAAIDQRSDALTYGITVRTDRAELGAGGGDLRRGAGYGGRGRPAGRRAHHPVLSHRPHLPPSGCRLPPRLATRSGERARDPGSYQAGDLGCQTRPLRSPLISSTRNASPSRPTTKLREAKPWHSRITPQRSRRKRLQSSPSRTRSR